jgi:hypothetical protein
LRVARRLIARDAASGGGFGEASCHDGAHTDVRQSTQTSGASVHTVWYDTTIVHDLEDYAGWVGNLTFTREQNGRAVGTGAEAHMLKLWIRMQHCCDDPGDWQL